MVFVVAFVTVRETTMFVDDLAVIVERTTVTLGVLVFTEELFGALDDPERDIYVVRVIETAFEEVLELLLFGALVDTDRDIYVVRVTVTAFEEDLGLVLFGVLVNTDRDVERLLLEAALLLEVADPILV